MSKQIIGKKWCFTLNNYSDDDIQYFMDLECKYIVIGREVGASGTPHLQGFVTFDKNKAFTGMKKLHAGAHWERAKGTSQQAADYCKKDGDYEEKGILSQQGKRTDLEAACAMVKDGKSMTAIAEEHPTTFVKFSRGLRELKLVLDKPYTPADLRGVWYWGPPGSGKSRRARFENPGAFLKSQSKWFDGYAGEKAIILDDLDTNVLGHYLKIWGDRYACTGETKGGTVNLQHDVIVVTSNYSIEQLWKDDENMQEAINRRFKVEYIGLEHNTIK